MTKRERAQLIADYMPLAEAAACRAAKRSPDIDLEDLKSEGYVGLCRAVDDWNPELGAFATYARFWVTHFIGRFIRSERMARGINTGEDAATWEIDSEDRATARLEAAMSVEKMIGALEGRDVEMLRFRFGLDDGFPKTLRETGERFRIVASTVLRAERRILDMLGEVDE